MNGSKLRLNGKKRLFAPFLTIHQFLATRYHSYFGSLGKSCFLWYV